MEATDYSSYELALKLKKCGFDEPCIAKWACEPYDKPLLFGSTAFVFCNSELKGRDVTAPFLWQAQKWLRDVCGVDMIIGLEDETDEPYSVEIYKGRKCVAGHWEMGFFAHYEQALAAGISTALQILDNEKK